MSSMLPPTTPVLPVEGATRPPSNSSDRKGAGKDFAKALDAAKTNDTKSADQKAAKSADRAAKSADRAAKSADRAAKSADRAESAKRREVAKSADDSAATPHIDDSAKTAESAGAVVDAPHDTASAVVEASVIATNIATNAVEATTSAQVTATQVPVVEVHTTPAVITTAIEAHASAAVATTSDATTANGEVALASTATLVSATGQAVTATADDKATTTPEPDVATDVSGNVSTPTTDAAVSNLVDTSQDQLLDALSKTVEFAVKTVAVKTGEVKIDNNPSATAAVANVHAPHNIIEAMSPNHTSTPATAPTAGANPADIPAPVRQLVNLVSPLRQHGDGDYRLMLQLHPEHLGRVEVAVTLNAGQISMQLSADSNASRQMLRESMNELRASLTSAGLDAGSLDVSSQDPRQHTNDTQSGQNSHVFNDAADADEDNFFSRLATVVNPPATDGQLDAYV